MAYDPGAIDSTLAAAVGDDAMLIAELRSAFLESSERTLAQLHDARDEAAWQAAAARLKGLAASFGAVRLMALADTAIAHPHNIEALNRITRAIARL